MQAVKVKIDDRHFLFPDGFEFPFPEYVIQHLPQIRAYIRAGEDLLAAMENQNIGVENILKRLNIIKAELSEFKARTGIIGTPFDLRDVDLYIANRHIDVTLIIDLNQYAP
ncbi:hypothetical protein [Pectobacterium carotovorum]|uniref:hypothetical protein n=1 Tax=Pectobacterium carotovorum TaxID=554 RepID=UPI000500F18F|nr:hypothetical protein [Pectobacterium carotovorum]KFW97586.1 hypothetical protein JV33_21525 [Pectobacterium carotovorum subsp. carotovorum]KML64944.1 hypothetical protein G032_20995 [Pectobacterium carotovorum subsp. carotovorum ICMP 5702]SHH68202.1 hypothetical protein SAMN05444147_11612 [Pectobacterium carotovorum]